MAAQTQITGRLRELARNMWWTWQPSVINLFRDLDPALKRTILDAALAIAADQASAVLPPNYTGWERATPETYALIETAGRALGRIGG